MSDRVRTQFFRPGEVVAEFERRVLPRERDEVLAEMIREWLR